MKKLMLVAALVVAGTSVAFAQDSMDNDYNYNSNDHRYGSQMSSDYNNDSRGNHRNSEYNNDYSTSYRSGSCCDGGSSSRRSGHRNNY